MCLDIHIHERERKLNELYDKNENYDFVACFLL